MRKKSFQIFIIASLLLHLLAGGGMIFLSAKIPQKIADSRIQVELIEPPKVEKIVKKDDKKALQIVENASSFLNEKEPEKTDFLSDKNRNTEKQTVAVQKGSFKNIKSQETKTAQKSAMHKTASQKTSHQELTKDLFGGFNAKKAMDEQAQKNQTAESPQTGDPSESQSNDYLKDIDKGLETVLNTKEFKYFTYYNRIRKQLTQFWEPKVREKVVKIFKQGRKIASAEDRITKLLIVLNNNGSLVKIQVMSDSGVKDLDDAAIEAFKAAAPFPNPPNGIVESDGTVKIRWDFVLET